MLTDSRQYYFDSQISRWLSVDPLATKFPSWFPYNYVLNNPLIFFDPDGMDVFIDKALRTPVTDENGNAKNVEDMNDEEKQRYYFQQWWDKNKEEVNRLFGKDGKYASTDIHFKLGIQKSNSRREFNIALTTFGKKDTERSDMNRGVYEVKTDYGTDQLKIVVWFNPHQRPNENTAEHEYKHVKIIFNGVQKDKVVPAAGDGFGNPAEGAQHWMIKYDKVPIIK